MIVQNIGFLLHHYTVP